MKARHLFVCIVVSLLGVVMISASTGHSEPPEPEIKILNRDLDTPSSASTAADAPVKSDFLDISEYLVNFHEHEFKHQREAVVVIKFPSCDGTIGRVFEYLDTTSKGDQISILGLKESAEPVYNSYREFYESKKINFRNHADHLKLKTNISIDYPELYFFERGFETNHMTANCNNFEQVIGNLEGFLNP